MLTSSNQYLRPDYLSPLPTTLDAKKSPLALLAQTCSAIGADSPNPKLISAAEKGSVKSSSKYADSSREKSPIVHASTDNKPSFKPYESCLTTREKTRTPEERGSANAHSKSPSSKGSASTTPQARCSSNHSSSSLRTSPPSHRKTPSDKSDDRCSPLGGSPAPSSHHKSDIVVPTATKLPFTSIADSKDSQSSFKPSVSVTSSAFLGGLPPAGFPLPVDLMTSGLMAAHHHALKNGLNPYLAYARMKAPGADAVCRDPYCTGCSLSSHVMKCPAGCAQCEHSKFPAYAQLAALAALPFVCSWMAGEASYCGKRFASSEELLAHLRGHTGAELPLMPRAYGPAARFHPYGKPPPPLVSPPLFPLPHPALAAYFPPYPLFGPRPLQP